VTDWKARCAELVAAWESYYPAETQGHYFAADLCDVLDRTRAELDQPEQEGPPKNCWKELCAELVLSRKLADWEDCEDLWARAEAALAQPEPEGLTDEEMWDLYYELERDPIRLAHAVLARCCGCFAKQ
jgi:hypothetical protein